jgi:hypothetical protein
MPPSNAPKPPIQARARKPKTSEAGGANADANLLPTSRVQKIIKSDGDIGTCQKEAVFLISAATVSSLSLPCPRRTDLSDRASSLTVAREQEHFIQKLTGSAYANARLDHRSTVQYRDLCMLVSYVDQLIL